MNNNKAGQDRHGRWPDVGHGSTADLLHEALNRIDETVDHLTPERVEARLSDLLARAGVSVEGVPAATPEDESMVDIDDLDLVRMVWEVEFGATGATVLAPTVRGDGAAIPSHRVSLADEAFEQLHGCARQEYDPPPRLDVSLNSDMRTLSVSVIVAGGVADDVENVTVFVPISADQVVRVPLAISRTDAMLTGTVRLDEDPVGAVLSPLRVEVVRRAR